MSFTAASADRVLLLDLGDSFEAILPLKVFPSSGVPVVRVQLAVRYHVEGMLDCRTGCAGPFSTDSPTRSFPLDCSCN